MLYERYAKRIQGLANVKNFIVHYRIIILTILVLITTLSITYTSTKGTLVNGINIAPSFEYGQTLEYSTDAFLSDVLGYQFKDVSSNEWVEEEPINVGSYEIRAITNKVGGYRYSTPYRFDIIPRELSLTLEDSEILYGTYPDIKVDGLQYNDVLTGVELKFDSITNKKTLVNAVITAAEIKNDQGSDVTNNYHISVITSKEEGSEVTFLSRKIEVTPYVEGKVYDGEAVVYNNSYKITSPLGLGYDDVLEITTSLKDSNGNTLVEAVEPGRYTITIEKIKINGNNPSDNYTISKKDYTFEIAKRNITVATKSIEKIYDGLELKGNGESDYGLSSDSECSLLNGHKLSLSNSISTSITNVGVISNEYLVTVLDEDGNDVSKYYDISYQYGTLTVNKRALTVKTESKVFTYNDEEFMHQVYEFNGLADTDEGKVVADSFATIKDSGTTANSFEYYVNDALGNDVTINYEITEEFGTLTVDPMNITITPFIDNCTYEGIIFDSTSAKLNVMNGLLAGDDNIIFDVSYSIDNEVTSTVTNSGLYTVSIANYEIVNSIASNYNVTCLDSTFEIMKRDVKLELIDQEKVFDNIEFIYPSDAYKVIDGSFIYDGEIEVFVNFSDTPLAAGSYTITYSDISRDVKVNHNIVSCSNATLTIHEKAVELRPYIATSKVYDGKMYEYDSNSFMIDGEPCINQLPLGGTINNLEVEYYQIDENNNYVKALPINAGTYYAKVSSYNYQGEGNYFFDTSNYTELIITKRKITIAPYIDIDNNSKVYDGSKYTYDINNFRVVSDADIPSDIIGSLYAGEKVQLKVKYNDSLDEPVNAGTYKVYGYEAVCDSLVLQNYEVTVSTEEYALYEITKREVTIIPYIDDDNDSKVYDGVAYVYDLNSFKVILDNHNQVDVIGSLYAGEKLQLRVKYNNSLKDPINVGLYEIYGYEVECDSLVLNNYDITISKEEYETYEITKRNVVLSLAPQTPWVYGDLYEYPNDSYIVYDELDPQITTLVGGEDVRFEVIYKQNDQIVTPFNAGVYQMYIQSYSNDIDKNYNITIDTNPVELVINPREVHVIPYVEKTRMTYDGLEHPYDINNFKVVMDNGQFCEQVNSLYAGEKIQLIVKCYNETLGYVDAPINAGTYQFYGYEAVCSEDVLANYTIIVDKDVPLEFVITPIEVEISPKLKELSTIYDGSRYVFDNEFTVIGNNNFIDAEIEVEVDSTFTAIDAREYNVTITNITFTSGLESNYKVIVTDVNFVIEQREISIGTKDINTVYNGRVYRYDSSKYLVYDKLTNTTYEDKLPCYNEGYEAQDVISELIVKYNDSFDGPVNAGTYTLTIDNFKSLVKSNYKVTEFISSTLVIKKRVLEIMPYIEEPSKTYDGNSYLYNYNKYTVVDVEFDNATYNYLPWGGTIYDIEVIYKDSLTLEELTISGPVNAGTYNVYLKEFSSSDDVKDNYIITISKDFITYTINKCNITLMPIEQKGVTYSGNEFVYPSDQFIVITEDGTKYINQLPCCLSSSDCSVLNSVEVEFVLDGTPLAPINAGTYEMYISGYDKLIDNNYNVTLSSEAVLFEIEKLTVEISPVLEKYSDIYNGSKHEIVPLYDVVGENDFIDAEIEVILAVDGEAINVGSYTVSIDSVEFISGVSDNYNVIYSGTCDYEITPRPVTISTVTQRTYVYDGYVHRYDKKYQLVDVDGTIYNSELPCTNEGTGKKDKITDFTIEYYGYRYGLVDTPLNADKYIVTIVDFDSDAKDNYAVTFENTAVMEISKRNIYLSVNLVEGSKVYDAEEYVYDSTKFKLRDHWGSIYTDKLPARGSLSVIARYSRVDEDGNVIDMVGAPVDVGTYRVYLSSYVYEGYDNYNITLSEDEYQTLVITKRHVTIMPYLPSPSKQYDGLPFEYDNSKYQVVIDEGEDVTSKRIYQLPGAPDLKLFVNYNGTSELPVNSGTYQIVGYKFTLGDQENYEITLSEKAASYSITKRIITIKPVDSGVIGTYNSEVHSLPNPNSYEIVSGKLLGDEAFTVITRVDGTMVNAGDYTVSISTKDITFTNGDSNNYSFRTIPTTVTIEKAHVIVELKSQSDYIYNGRRFEYPQESYQIITVNGEKRRSLYLGEKFGVSVIYYDKNDVLADPVNVGKYKIVGYEFEDIYNLNIFDNYTFEFKENRASVEVVARSIYINSMDSEHVYGDIITEHDFDYELVVGGEFYDLAQEHTMKVYVYYLDEDNNLYLANSKVEDIPVEYRENYIEGYPKNQGNYRIVISRVEIYDASFRLVEDNYDIGMSQGKLNIQTMDIKVSLVDQSVYYSNSIFKYPQSRRNVKIEEGTLISGDSLEVKVYYINLETGEKLYEPIDVGRYQIFIEEVIVDTDKESNYNVGWDETSEVFLEIKPKMITIQPTVLNELTYNFDQQTPNLSWEYGQGSNEFEEGHSIKPVTFKYYDAYYREIDAKDIIDAGKYYVMIEEYELINASSKNYSIVSLKVAFEIKPLDITVKLSDQEKTYDGLTFDKFGVKEVTTNTIELLGQVSSLEFEILNVLLEETKEPVEIINAGTYIVTAGDVNLKDIKITNFNINYEASTYLINKKTINLTLTDDSSIFDGNCKEYNGYTFDGFVDGQALKAEFEFVMNDTTYQKDELVHAGQYQIIYKSYSQYDEENNLLDSLMTNYDVVVTNTAKYTIEKLGITIATTSANMEYTGQAYTYHGRFYDVGGHSIDRNTSITFDVYYVDENGNVLDNPIEIGKYAIIIDNTTVNVDSIYDDYIVYVSSSFEENGTLTISKYLIQVEINDVLVTYGTDYNVTYNTIKIVPGYTMKLSFNYFDANGNLVVDSNGNPTLPINVGTYTIKCSEYELYYGSELLTDIDHFEIEIINNETATITINPYDLLIEGINLEKVYDASPFARQLKEYTMPKLCYDDEVSVVAEIYLNNKLYMQDMIHANVYNIVIDCDFIKGNPDNYNIIIVNGSYTITPKQVNIVINTPDPNSKEYDGLAVTNFTWDYRGDTPIFGDEIVIDYVYMLEGEVVDKVVDVGNYTITMDEKYKVVGTNGSYQTDYDVNCSSASYNITARPIEVLTGTLSAYYCGYNITYTEGFSVSLGSLALDTHKILWDGESVPTAIIPNARGVENELGVIIVNEKGDDISFNYEITMKYGKIYVLKRPITVTSGSKTSVYNGYNNPLTCTDFTVTDNITDNSILALELSTEFDFSITRTTSLRYVYDEAVDNDFRFKAYLNNDNVAGYFEVTEAYGKLQLLKRDLVITINNEYLNEEYWYNGKELDASKFITVSEDITKLGDMVNANASLVFRRLTDKYDKYLEEAVIEEIIQNAGYYQITIGDVKIKRTSSSTDLTQNYNIIIDVSECEDTYVKIKPLTVVLESGSLAKVWDGELLQHLEFEVINQRKAGYDLLNNHLISVNYDGNNASIGASDENGNEIRNITVDNKLEYVIYDSKGNIYNDNYIIYETPGKLRVVDEFIVYWNEEIPYTSKNQTIEKLTGSCITVDGEVISNLTYEVLVDIFEQDMLELGTYPLSYIPGTLKLYLNGVEATDLLDKVVGYELIYEIAKINISIRPQDLTITYDGKDHSCTTDEFDNGINYLITKGDLLEGHYAQITTSRFIDAGLIRRYSDNRIITITIYDENGVDVTDYYDIDTSGRSILEVVQIVFVYETASIEVTYDGLEHSVTDEVKYDASLLLPGHHIVFKSYTSVAIAVGEHKNTIEFDIVDEFGNSVIDYYNCDEFSTIGTIKILPRVIAIESGSATKDYDGKALTCSDWNFIDATEVPDENEGLLSEHRIVVINTGTRTSVGSSKNKFTVQIFDKDGNDVTAYYDYQTYSVEGTLTVTK